MVERIVTEVANEEDVDESSLPPLGETLDTDALVSLSASNDTVHISFEYQGYDVHIMEDGSVQLIAH